MPRAITIAVIFAAGISVSSTANAQAVRLFDVHLASAVNTPSPAFTSPVLELPKRHGPVFGMVAAELATALAINGALMVGWNFIGADPILGPLPTVLLGSNVISPAVSAWPVFSLARLDDRTPSFFWMVIASALAGFVTELGVYGACVLTNRVNVNVTFLLMELTGTVVPSVMQAFLANYDLPAHRTFDPFDCSNGYGCAQ